MNTATMTGIEILENESQDTQESKRDKDPHKYQKLADNLIMDIAKSGKSFLRYYQGRTLRYNGSKYYEEHELANFVRRHFLSRKIPINNTVISNVVPIIEARLNLDPHRYPQLPFWWTQDNEPLPCDPKDVITFKNGILDVSKAINNNHTLIPHTYDWVSLTCLPHDYLPVADCPRWLDFLNEVLEGDNQRIALLQEFFGYCLLADNSYQKLLVLLGVSRGGKGTVVKVLEALLGSENMTGYSLTSLADKFGLGGLVGKLVASVGEVNLQANRDKYQIFERLNNITGDDPVEVEYKHNPIKMSMRLPVRFVVACNQMPHFADDSGALAERLLIINFDKTCPPEKRDPALAAKLTAEISGITNWAIVGLARLRSTGKFSVCQKSLDSINQIRRKNSSVLAFAQDRLIIHNSLDTGNLPGVDMVGGDISWTTEDNVRTEFHEWCKDNDGGCNQNYLYSNLCTLIPKLVRGKKTTAFQTRQPVYIGVQIKPLLNYNT